MVVKCHSTSVMSASELRERGFALVYASDESASAAEDRQSEEDGLPGMTRMLGPQRGTQDQPPNLPPEASLSESAMNNTRICRTASNPLPGPGLRIQNIQFRDLCLQVARWSHELDPAGKWCLM